MRARVEGLFRDVYRDLRDRRLLSIAIVLLLAIVAAPLLIKGGGDDSATGAGTASELPVEGTEVIDPVVLAETPALRDFQKRLDELESRNPFRQQLTGGVGPSLEDTSAGLGETESSTSTTSIADTTATGETTDTTETTDTSTTDDGTATDSSGGTAPADDQPTDNGGDDEATLVTTRIDVRVGPAGKTKVERGVKSLDYLPDRQHPVLQFVQGEFDLSGAAFLVSSEVTATEGKGRCAPSPQNCEFLLLGVGEEQKFVYGPQGEVYRLELLAVEFHEEPIAAEDEPDTQDQPGANRFSLGGVFGR